MNKLLSSFLFGGCSLFLFGSSLSVAATPGRLIGVPTSGIDWASSTVAIQSFNAAHPSHEANFQCFGQGYSDLPISTSLAAITFDNPSHGPDVDTGAMSGATCFQQAGSYNLQITLVDQVGNVGQADAYLLTVKAGEGNDLLTTLEPIAYIKETNNPAVNTLTGSTTDCTEDRLIANNGDGCTLRLTVRDDFGNVVEIPSVIGRMSVPGRDATNVDLNLMADAEQSYVDSVRMNGNVDTLPFSTNAEGQFDFDVSALAPTIEVITSPVNTAFSLARIIPRNTPFQFPIPGVDDEGNLILSSTTDVTKAVDLQFEPWVKLTLSDVAPEAGSPSSPSEPLYFLQGEQKRIYTFADTMLDHFLPDSFQLFVKGFSRPVGLFFEAEDITNGASDIDGDTVAEGLEILVSGNARSQSSDFTTRLKSETSLLTDENIALGSKIRHAFTEAGLVKRVIYPGGNLGSSLGPDEAFPGITLPEADMPGAQPGDITALRIGADIEGKVLADKDVRLITPEDTKFVTLGGVSSVDIREDVLRNATVLTRGLAPINALGANTNFNINTSFSGDVAYVKGGTVTLVGSSFSSGVKTLVIEDGNLFIPNDLSYASIDDSLGVIMINSDPNSRITGNIFVKNTVQRVVGTYYADGSLLSTDVNANPQESDTINNRSLTNVDDPNAPLGLQLLLEGTILSRNTLGGALLDPPVTPWGLDTQEAAIKYDLHFVRRYVPPIDPVTFALLPDSANDQCVKQGTVCDSNRHSFVIKSDGRAQNLTPPGFDQLSGFSAQ